MDVGLALIAHSEAAKAVEPSHGALDDPTVVPEPVAMLDAAPRDPGLDVAPATVTAADAMVVGLVGVQLLGPAAWPPARPLAAGRARGRGAGGARAGRRLRLAGAVPARRALGGEGAGAGAAAAVRRGGGR